MTTKLHKKNFEVYATQENATVLDAIEPFNNSDVRTKDATGH